MTQQLQNFFDTIAPGRDYWIEKNRYYYDELFKLHRLLVGQNKKVLDIGCGTGQLLAALKPKEGKGIDFSQEMIKIAAQKYPKFNFQIMDAEFLEKMQPFDYILLSNLVGYTEDIWQVFRNLHKVSAKSSRIVITNYNYWWQPVFALAEKLQLKMPDRIQNWLPQEFIVHFLQLTGFEVVKKGKYLHLPVFIPFISNIINSLCVNLPLVSDFGLIEYIVARPVNHNQILKDVDVTVIVPTREEAGNIENIVEQMPQIGKSTEIIFVDLPGKDSTKSVIFQKIKQYKGKLTLRYIEQKEESGKFGAIKFGVEKAQGEIILIFDADLTIPPQDLVKFYLALIENRGELINGTRLVYPTEKGALRFLNHLGNWVFARLFTWGLGQHFTDTLCGTKGFWKKDFLNLQKNREFYDHLDTFGDFFLLLGAYRNNLKIVEVPVRYKTRKYGDTKLDRIKNGWQFLKMFSYFFWKYKILRK